MLAQSTGQSRAPRGGPGPGRDGWKRGRRWLGCLKDVGGAAEVEHARLLTLGDVLALLDRDLARADLVHADADEGHEADGWVVGLDEDDGARRERRQVALADGDAAGVNLAHRGVPEPLEQRLGEVGAVLDEGLLDRAADGRVPAVVGERGQEGLVDGAAGEVVAERVVGQHVADRVRLALDPEVVPQLDVMRHLEHLALTAVGDDVVVLGRRDRPHLVAELAGEVVVPRGVAVVLLGGIAHEEVLELVRGAQRRVGDRHDVVDARGAEPAALGVVQDLGGLGGEQEFAPVVEDLLEVGVDLGVEEGGVARGRAHGVVEEGAHGDADHADVGGGVGPLRGGGEGVVQHLEHVVVVADLLVAGGVLVVGVLDGHLVEHGVEVHVDARVVLDELLEVLEHRRELFGVLLGILDLFAQPLLVDAVVCWQPCAWSDDVCEPLVGRRRWDHGRANIRTSPSCAHRGCRGGLRAGGLPWWRYGRGSGRMGE
nr:hypothetical protein CFP56_24550 [Quercus suber]